MKSLIVICASILILGWYQQTCAAEPHGARIEFKEENFDFGEVSNDTLLQHVFVFTNTGEDTLEIKRVSSG